jgi:hypothetical protein
LPEEAKRDLSNDKSQCMSVPAAWPLSFVVWWDHGLWAHAQIQPNLQVFRPKCGPNGPSFPAGYFRPRIHKTSVNWETVFLTSLFFNVHARQMLEMPNCIFPNCPVLGNYWESYFHYNCVPRLFLVFFKNLNS